MISPPVHPQIDQLLSLLDRRREVLRSGEADKVSATDPDKLNDDLIALLSATGSGVFCEEDQIWAEMDAAEKVSPAKSAKAIMAIARDRDPLTAARTADSLIQNRINNALHGWWNRYRSSKGLEYLPSRILDVTWSQLRSGNTDQESEAQKQVRLRIRQLGSFDQSQVSRGRPFKGDQDVLLHSLADLFLRYSGDDQGPMTLPVSPQGHFIQFAHHALAPFFHLTEVSPGALSKRWKRILESATAEPAPIKSARDRRRR